MLNIRNQRNTKHDTKVFDGKNKQKLMRGRRDEKSGNNRKENNISIVQVKRACTADFPNGEAY